MAVGKFVLLFFLYFAQGLPYGIQTKLIPILLRTRSVSLSKVGFSRFLSFPWLFKIFLAKYLEAFSSIWLWLALTFFGMAVCCGVSGLFGTHLIFVVLVGIFGLNVMAASQDIAVDTMAIRVLDSCDLGKGNIAQVVGYKVGALTGGGLLVWMSVYANWEILFTGCITRSKGFTWIVLYVFMYKLGEQGMASMVPLFLLDNGFSPGDVGLMTGMGTQFFSIFGSIIGGWMASEWSTSSEELIRLLKWISIARLVPMATHCLAVSSSQSMTFLLVSECVLQLTAGIITTVTFTLMMQFSKDVHSSFQATHFSVLATVEVLGKLCMMSLSGTLVELMGYFFYFLFCFFLSLGVVPILIFSNSEQMTTHKS